MSDTRLTDAHYEGQCFSQRDKDFACALERKLRTIHDLVEGDADGTPDASDYEHLCNRIEGIISAP